MPTSARGHTAAAVDAESWSLGLIHERAGLAHITATYPKQPQPPQPTECLARTCFEFNNFGSLLVAGIAAGETETVLVRTPIRRTQLIMYTAILELLQGWAAPPSCAESRLPGIRMRVGFFLKPSIARLPAPRWPQSG